MPGEPRRGARAGRSADTPERPGFPGRGRGRPPRPPSARPTRPSTTARSTGIRAPSRPHRPAEIVRWFSRMDTSGRLGRQRSCPFKHIERAGAQRDGGLALGLHPRRWDRLPRRFHADLVPHRALISARRTSPAGRLRERTSDSSSSRGGPGDARRPEAIVTRWQLPPRLAGDPHRRGRFGTRVRTRSGD